MKFWRCFTWLTDSDYRKFKRESNKRSKELEERIKLDEFRMTLAYEELVDFLTCISLPPNLFFSDIRYINKDELERMNRFVKHFDPVYNKYHKKLVEVVEDLKKQYEYRKNENERILEELEKGVINENNES